MYQPEPNPKFSWSHSRDRTLRDCERRYYWHYYGSHSGWAADAPEETRLAYRLKQLTDLPLVLGQAIHERAREMAQAIRDRRPRPDAAQLRSRTRSELNRVWQSSRQERQEFLRQPNRVPMLLPVYYGREVSGDLIARMKTRMEDSLRHLLASPVWSELEECGPADLLIADSVTAFEYRKIETYAAPDLLYRTQGTWIILDWKTGSPGRVQQQLGIYGLFLRHQIGDPAENAPWLGRVVRLDNGEDLRFLVGTQQLDRADQVIAASIERMRQFVVEGDLNRNEALDQQSFSLAPDQRRCLRCPFFEICQPDLT